MALIRLGVIRNDPKPCHLLDAMNASGGDNLNTSEGIIRCIFNSSFEGKLRGHWFSLKTDRLRHLEPSLDGFPAGLLDQRVYRWPRQPTIHERALARFRCGCVAMTGKAVETAFSLCPYRAPAVNGWSKDPAGKPPEGG